MTVLVCWGAFVVGGAAAVVLVMVVVGGGGRRLGFVGVAVGFLVV